MEKIIESQIIDIINDKLSPSVLNLINESFMHNVPPGSESHFKLIVVSDVFKDLTNVKRHQLIYSTLNKIMDEIHALSIYAFDENEYNANPIVIDSPNCANK
jgi:BolA protein